mgnify:CR=1 FL=1
MPHPLRRTAALTLLCAGLLVPAATSHAGPVTLTGRGTRPELRRALTALTIGFNVETRRLDASYYDLLASEARIASFVAIARGDVPAELPDGADRAGRSAARDVDQSAAWLRPGAGEGADQPHRHQRSACVEHLYHPVLRHALPEQRRLDGYRRVHGLDAHRARRVGPVARRHLTSHTQFGGRAIDGYDAVDGSLPVDRRIERKVTELGGQWRSEADTMRRWLAGWQQPPSADPSGMGAHLLDLAADAYAAYANPRTGYPRSPDIGEVKKIIRLTTLEHARQVARRVMSFDSERQVLHFLREETRKIDPEVF